MDSTDQSEDGLSTIDYLPARMVNEWVYCPRLFYLMHVERQFADSFETIDGQIVHRRVDSGSGTLAAAPNIPQADEPLAPEPSADPPRRKKRPKHIQPPTLFDEPSQVTAGDGQAVNSDATAERMETENELPADEETKSRIHARSVTLSCDTTGVIAKLDLVEATGRQVTPVDYKRGRPKTGPTGQLDAWMPEKVQLALQALVLRANGYTCDSGVLYFNETRQRVTIPFDEELIEFTQKAAAEAKQLVADPRIPPPLVDSPKCPKCSLVNICLPEETRLYLGRNFSQVADKKDDEPRIRPIVTARDERRPLYLNHQGLHVGKRDQVLIAKAEGKVVQEIRLHEILQVNLFGNVQLSTQAIQTLLNLQIPIGYYTKSGWFYGISHSLGVKNILVRREQFRRADDAGFCLYLARQWVRSKIQNCRTFLMRNHTDPPAEAKQELKRLAHRAMTSDSPASLLGIEGTAARIYFSHFAGMLKVGCDLDSSPGAALSEKRPAFDFRGRNRRPPRDPVNALLSLAYSLLTKDCHIAATSVGLDPYLGFYHQIKPGKPALALDLMEPFRPLIADSVVLSAINNRMVAPEHFLVAGQSVVLSDTGRKRFLLAYEQRMDAMVTHPVFGYRVSYRRLLEIQTRLLARYLTGEIEEYPSFETR